jgi:hypothetical protein
VWSGEHSGPQWFDVEYSWDDDESFEEAAEPEESIGVIINMPS